MLYHMRYIKQAVELTFARWLGSRCFGGYCSLWQREEVEILVERSKQQQVTKTAKLTPFPWLACWSNGRLICWHTTWAPRRLICRYITWVFCWCWRRLFRRYTTWALGRRWRGVICWVISRTLGGR